MATKKMIQIVNKDKKLAVLFGGIVIDGVILIALVAVAIMIVI
jgi:hypothetical protein